MLVTDYQRERVSPHTPPQAAAYAASRHPVLNTHSSDPDLTASLFPFLPPEIVRSVSRWMASSASARLRDTEGLNLGLTARERLNQDLNPGMGSKVGFDVLEREHPQPDLPKSQNRGRKAGSLAASANWVLKPRLQLGLRLLLSLAPSSGHCPLLH